MATCRDVCAEALRVLGALAPGDEGAVDELAAALDAMQTLILELHARRGPMIDVDVAADYTAGENQRIRIEQGATATVSLPNSVAVFPTGALYDYGFVPSASTPPLGGAAASDGATTRAPRDGSRIEIVGVTQALWLYRADMNEWVSVLGLTLDTPFPLNERYRGDFAALIAERLADAWPALYEPTPGLMRRIQRAGFALALRPGDARDPVRAEFL